MSQITILVAILHSAYCRSAGHYRACRIVIYRYWVD